MGRQADSKFLNRSITFESNRNSRFEFESNLEASQVPKPDIHVTGSRSGSGDNGARLDGVPDLKTIIHFTPLVKSNREGSYNDRQKHI